MRSRLLFWFSITVTFASAPLVAQDTAPPAKPTAVPGMQDPQEMMRAYEAAQAAANRPGDKKLSCQELQAQFTEVVNDPTIKANVEAGGAAAQRDMAAMQAANGATGATTGASAAASMLPGGEWAAYEAAVAQAEAAKARGAGRLQAHAARAQGATEMMPKLMRGQRLIELGAAKNCEWAASLNANTPAAGSVSKPR